MRWPRELLQAGQHRRVRLLAALLASAPDALVLADARPPATSLLRQPEEAIGEGQVYFTSSLINVLYQ
jgi:hypothetical protein